MPSPLLTIVIPVYNVEEYLRECLDSIVNQTYTNLEIIIVNDCTPDNSEEIILEYQSKNPRIKYIKHEKNLGLGGARNTGITNATGEWITFVDSDDYIDLYTYECMMDLIQKNNVNMGVFSTINFDDITKREYYDPYFDTPNLVKLSNENFFGVRNVTAWNKIYKFSDIIDNGVYFPEHLKHEDEEFWFKYIAIVEPTVIGNPIKFYHYRQREGSIMGQGNFRHNMVYIAQNIYKFLVEKNLLEKYKKPFLYNVSEWTHSQPNPLISKEANIKNYSILHDLLQQFPNKDLMPLVEESTLPSYPELFTIKNLIINENSLEFLKEFKKLQDDKWYRFGQLSRKDKIKFIIKTTIKKTLKKLRLFEFAKSIKNNIFRR